MQATKQAPNDLLTNFATKRIGQSKASMNGQYCKLC
jgi:hypothetical protein